MRIRMLGFGRICEGLVAGVQMKKKALEVSANLKNIVILDCDKETLYKKVCNTPWKRGAVFKGIIF